MAGTSLVLAEPWMLTGFVLLAKIVRLYDNKIQVCL